MQDQWRIYNNGQERLIYTIFLCLVMWLPIPLGSNRDWAWSILEVISSGLLTWASLLVVSKRMVVPSVIKHLRWVILLLFMSMLLLAAQIVPLDSEILAKFSPLYQTIYSHSTVSSISIDTGVTLGYLLQQLAYVSLFMLALMLLTSKRRIKTFFMVIAVSGLAQAILAISQWLSLQASGIDVLDITAVSGTFVNKNHFAAYLNLVVAAILALILYEVYDNDQHYKGVLNKLSRSVNALFGFLLIVLFAIIITKSRGALFSLGIAILAVISCVLMNEKARAAIGIQLISMLVLLVGTALFLGKDIVSERLVSMEQDYSSRTEIWDLTLKVINDFPLLGVGGGNFANAIPLYETRNMEVFVNHAHSDYLELIAEQGYIGFAILFLVVAISLVYALRAIKSSATRSDFIVTCAGVFGVAAMLAHAAIEFNFYIPSNAAYFYIFLALMVAGTRINKLEKQEANQTEVQLV